MNTITKTNTTTLNHYGLIGYPLSHSFSPTYFQQKFEKAGITNCRYDLYPLKDIREIKALFSKVKGLNVTIPYKEAVIPFLDMLDPVAEEIGAVNTIKVLPNGLTCGFNTDAYGFEKSLTPLLKNQEGAFIMGTGGASKAVKYVLDKIGIDVAFLSRSPRPEFVWSYSATNNYYLRNYYSLVINTTPLGMYPNAESCPDIPYHLYNESSFFYDLIYNPEQTTFLKKGLAQGATIKNGLEMLELQADRSWEIWRS